MIGTFTKEQMDEFKKKSQEKRNAVIQEFLRDFPYPITNYYRLLPDTFKWNWLQSFSGKSSMKSAIKAKCADCVCYQREEIEKCTVRTCPLWSYRPYQGKNMGDGDDN
jgi:hypothetical protein